MTFAIRRDLASGKDTILVDGQEFDAADVKGITMALYEGIPSFSHRGYTFRLHPVGACRCCYAHPHPVVTLSLWDEEKSWYQEIGFSIDTAEKAADRIIDVLMKTSSKKHSECPRMYETRRRSIDNE